MFRKFPYSNLHDLNLDWIVSKIKNVEDVEKCTEEYAYNASQSASQASLDASNAQISATNASISASNAEQSAQSIPQALEELEHTNARLDEIIPDGQQTEGNTELIDIRTWYDGRSSATAGTAVRGQASEVVNAITKLDTYGIPPYQLSLFKNSDNIFNNFNNYREGSYYASTLANENGVINIVTTPNWKGWLIRVKPNTTYTLGPLDFSLIFFNSNFHYISKIETAELSNTNPNTITTPKGCYWLSVTQRIARDMSQYMMVEGDTYPSEYIDSRPQWVDAPMFADGWRTRIGLFYASTPIQVIFNKASSGATVIIPDGRIITEKGAVVVSGATLTFVAPQFLSYDMTNQAWVQANAIASSDLYLIGFINSNMNSKSYWLNANVKATFNKVIAFMGDSLTAGSGWTGEPNSQGYHQYIHDLYGYTCLNYGYGGSGYIQSWTGAGGYHGIGEAGRGVATTVDNAIEPNNVRSRLTDIPNKSDIDAVVIFAGTNDWSHQIPLANFEAELDATFDYYYNNFGSSPLLVMTPIHRLNDDTSTIKLIQYVDAIIRKCREHGVPYIDTFSMSGLDPNNSGNSAIFFPRDDSATHSNDGVHPNHLAHQRLARCIGETLNQLVKWNTNHVR